MIQGIYTPKYHLDTRFYQIFANHYRDFCTCYDERFRRTYGNFRFVVDKVVDKFLRCGKPKDGFAYVECEDCGHRYLVPFSCKTRMCPSCGQKRLLGWSEWLFEEVLFNVEHRQWVFTIPACLRWCFRFHRQLLGDLAGCAADTLMYYMQQITGHKEAYPGIIPGIHISILLLLLVVLPRIEGTIEQNIYLMIFSVRSGRIEYCGC